MEHTVTFGLGQRRGAIRSCAKETIVPFTEYWQSHQVVSSIAILLFNDQWNVEVEVQALFSDPMRRQLRDLQSIGVANALEGNR